MNNHHSIERIQALKQERRALILAHNYQRPEVQDIADHRGDSLELAMIAARSPEPVIVCCGVRFMAETVSILCPEKTVLLPSAEAGCDLADTVTPDDVRSIRAQHPDCVVVAYINSSAEVKAESDLCCTSSNAVAVVRSISRKRPVCLVPDHNLARHVARVTGRQLVLWKGRCPAHAVISSSEVRRARRKHPEALVMAHPECDQAVLELADYVGGTAGMLTYARRRPSGSVLLVGTESGMLYRLAGECPDKRFLPLSDTMTCQTMAYTGLANVEWSLECLEHRIVVEDSVRVRAVKSIEAMLAITGRKTRGDGVAAGQPGSRA